MRVSPYWKAVIAGLGPVLLAVDAAVTDDQITSVELVRIIVAVGIVAGVWRVPNRPR